jgi:hypothetical protein
MDGALVAVGSVWLLTDFETHYIHTLLNTHSRIVPLQGKKKIP